MKINTTHIRSKVYSTALKMLCCVALFSCVKVDLCEEPTHAHLGNVKLVYHWPDDIPVDERPDSMFAFINRVITAHRIGYVTGSETSIGGRYRFGDVNHDNVTTDPINDQQPLMTGAGKHWVFALNNDIVDNKAHYRENIDIFFSEKKQSETGVRDLYISYVPHEITDPILYSYSKNWIDFNPYSKHIAPGVKPIYSTYNESSEAKGHIFNVPKDGKAEVHLYPQKITQDITISFPIYSDSLVYVDSIIAEISGIPYKMSVYDRTLMADTTYKMFFEMNVDTVNIDTVDITINSVAKRFKKMECNATISVMGLLANKLPKHTTGAGILQLCIYLRSNDEENVLEKKNLYTKINLYNTINDANLVITDDWGNIIQNPGTYSQFPLSDTLRIEDNFLLITRDFVLNALNKDNSLDTWLGDNDGDGEIDNDHKLDVEM